MPPEEKVEVTEAPVEEILPEGDAPFKSTEEAPVEPEVETTEEAEEIAEAIKPGEAEEEPEDEVEKILKEPEAEDEKSNVQRRIDRLTAELKSLKDENVKLQGKQPTAEKAKYTEDQLATAMMKAVEDNDKVLMRDIIVEIQRNVKDDLVKMYNTEKETAVKQVQAIQNEWNETVNAYSRYSDTKVPEIYTGSRKDLSLTDASALLYQVALALYTSDDPEKKRYYQAPGGQKLAVADALTYILRNKAGKGISSKVKKLEKQLTKERMKKSPVSGGPGAEEKAPRRPQTAEDTLAEVIEERKKYQEERGV